jgi:predicted DNA-binding transcriptional regulator YafY
MAGWYSSRMYHPTTRVLAVLELLQTHGRISGADLAARLAVDARTLRRYIATLEEMGIPITTQRGRFGGYALMAGFKLPPMMFTDDEALALAVGLLAARKLGLAQSAPAVASAQAKLERIMPSALQSRVRAVSDTVRLDLAQGPASADGGQLAMLSSAALACQRVHLEYRALDGTHSARDLDPYGLAFYGGSWYVLGMCHLRASLRSFRLDRVLKAELRPASFGRPADFDVLAHLRHSIATMARSHRVEVLLATDLETASRHFFDTIGVFQQSADGVLLRSETDDLDWFAGQLAGMPFGFAVIAPEALRGSVARLGERLLRLASA